jgi:hypothetical protein
MSGVMLRDAGAGVAAEDRYDLLRRLAAGREGVVVGEVGAKGRVDLAGEVAPEAADDLALGLWSSCA